MEPAPKDRGTKELVLAAQDGDAAALDALMTRYLPALRAFVRLRCDRVLRARESSSDLVQTACREAIGALEEFEWRSEGSFRNWLFAFALNKIRNRRNHFLAQKRDARRELRGTVGDVALQAAYSGLSPTQAIASSEGIDRIEAAIDALPEAYREVVLLSRFVGLSSQEIAEQTGKADGAVRVQLSRALARLASLLERDGPG